jgi:hypothetical protein
MPAVQTTYPSVLTEAIAGAIVNGELLNKTSYTVSNAGGVPFGRPVSITASTNGKQCHLTTAGDTTVAGFSIIDRANDSATDQYDQYDSAAVMTQGVMWVPTSVEVNPETDVVAVVAATGAVTNVAAGNILISGARFESEAGIGELVQLRLQ